MKDDELILSGSLDQPLNGDPSEFLQLVDDKINKAIAERDLAKVVQVCKQLILAQQFTGLALAKVFYKLKQHWDELAPEDNDEPGGKADFVQVMFEATGKHRHTIDRYLAIWDMFEKKVIPDGLTDTLKSRNVKELVPIANAVAQGYKVADEQWEAIAQAPDLSSVLRIVREDIKGAPPRQGAVFVMLDELGNIWAYSDGDRHFVGALEIDSENEVVQKAIARIVQNAGVMRNA
jgi:hypothetical protein